MSQISYEFNRLKKIPNSNDLKVLRSIVLDSIEKSFHTLDPNQMVKNAVWWSPSQDRNTKCLNFKGFNGQSFCNVNFTFTLKEPKKNEFNSVLIIGGGKASYFMTRSLIEIIGMYFPCYGLINLPEGQNFGEKIIYEYNSVKSSVLLNYARHPIPNEQGLRGTEKIIELAQKADENTLILVVISGGGSALMPCPKEGLSLESKQKVNSILIKCGAEIKEINTIRKHLSRFKGGNLAKHIFPHSAVTLIISDVIGDPLDVIASGPTVPDESTYQDCLEILKKYNILEAIPSDARDIILKGINGEIEENPKKGLEIFGNIKNLLIGSVENAKSEIVLEMNKQKIPELANYIPDNKLKTAIDNLKVMKGESSEYGRVIAEILENIAMDLQKRQSSYEENVGPRKSQLLYLLNSGEFTVTIRGNGTGGRNQEMLLSLLLHLKENYPDITKSMDFCMISIAFDGIEGNSPAAGAIIDSNSINKAIDCEKKYQIPLRKYLENNDSYSFFKKIGDAIEIGQTGTNVNDLSLLVLNFLI